MKIFNSEFRSRRNLNVRPLPFKSHAMTLAFTSLGLLSLISCGTSEFSGGSNTAKKGKAPNQAPAVQSQIETFELTGEKRSPKY
ncbi:MAG: hypothetical protein NT027_11155 [Proteobacteria bacterium]|nr:hypothetical protein [Pseudomonadota bacterium]